MNNAQYETMAVCFFHSRLYDDNHLDEQIRCGAKHVFQNKNKNHFIMKSDFLADQGRRIRVHVVNDRTMQLVICLGWDTEGCKNIPKVLLQPPRRILQSVRQRTLRSACNLLNMYGKEWWGGFTPASCCRIGHGNKPHPRKKGLLPAVRVTSRCSWGKYTTPRLVQLGGPPLPASGNGCCGAVGKISTCNFETTLKKLKEILANSVNFWQQPA